MKPFILVFSLILSLSAFSQREKFDCQNINHNILETKYNELKSCGLEYITKTEDGKNVDLMYAIIKFFDFSELRQVCINAWGQVHNNGAEYCYKRFIETIGYVDKTKYMENIDYYEMFFEIRKSIAATGY